MLPCRYILINQQVFKGVLELDVIPLNNTLQLHISIHQFKANLTESIISSFDVNSANRNFFSALAIEKIATIALSLNQSEELFLYIQGMLSKLTMNEQLHELNLMNQMTLYLLYDQLFKMNNFVQQFITTYEMCKMQLAQIQNQTQQQTYQSDIATTVQNDGVPVEPVVEEQTTIEFENPDNSSEITLLNDCLLMSPTMLTTYYISRHVLYILNQPKKEKIHFEFNKETVVIHLSPLVQQELIEMSDDHYTDLINIASSFDYSPEEYITKLRLLVRHLLFIINNYTKSNNVYFITVKIIEFLILLYTIKLSPASFLEKVKLHDNDVTLFKDNVDSLVNYALDFILKHHIAQGQVSHTSITFKHYPRVEYFEDDFDGAELRQLLSKELYLIDVDKEFFINQVITKVDKEAVNDHNLRAKVVFNKPITINIATKLSTAPLNNASWLDYQTVIPEQKQFSKHTIITPDYLQLLQVTNLPNISKNLLKDLHPILSKYANIIVNQIFKELSVCDTKHSISTLYLLNTHVRPYLHADATMKIEMYILYRIVIPHLHDVYNANLFIDYFH